MKKIYLALTCILFLFIFITFYLSLDNKKIYNTEEIIGLKINQIELVLFDNSGKFNTKEIENHKFSILNFWASWCGPCRKEHRHLMILSKNKNLKIIGVNFKDDENSAKKFLEEMGNPFFVLTKDTDGKKSVDFGIYGIPETILVSQDLRVLKKYVGPINNKDVKEIIEIINR